MIRVLIVGGITLVRGALVALLAHEGDIEVVAELPRGEDVLPTARRVKPDVAVIDIDPPNMDGLAAARKLREFLPTCETLILTGIGTPRALRQALDAKARGFVVMDETLAEHFADCIRQVSSGEFVVDTKLAVNALYTAGDLLTSREHDVLNLAAEGSSVCEIARRLHLAPGTVRNYLSVIINKLHARNRLDAVRIARGKGWI
ncbi:LuxR C-terminal-related transcriptional regulator [Actinopolymorpha rutila]|uniref:Two-component system response regulator DesR n=1 Tax=Actinopolymorpha rutila TaxID=446787 RepID=A0A852ZFV9_9ACTN|nr:two-component system response regulator DesR [Actinopolymorpha rutila]